jgi:hypothetical protein
MANRPQISREAIDRIRAKIRASELVGRLEEFALGNLVTVGEVQNGEITYRTVLELPDGTRKPAMTKEQISAAKVLLDKVLATPQSIDVNTSETKTFVIRAPEPSKSMDEWLNHYGPKTIDATPTPSPSGSPSPARKRLS